jgi:hypothetical protein
MDEESNVFCIVAEVVNTVCSERRLIGHWLTRVKDTEPRTTEASNHTRWRNTDWPTDQVINDLRSSGRYQCLPIRCSGRLINPHNEHSIYRVIQEELPPRTELISYIWAKRFIWTWVLYTIFTELRSYLEMLYCELRVAFVNVSTWRVCSVYLRRATCAVHKRADKSIEAEGCIFENVL